MTWKDDGSRQTPIRSAAGFGVITETRGGRAVMGGSHAILIDGDGQRAQYPKNGVTVLISTATADADPLGVDMNVTFDNVGGLDDRECDLCFGVRARRTFRLVGMRKDPRNC